MDKLIINGGSKISGSVNVHGSKNSALPIIVSSLLSEKTLKLSNVPNVVDVLNLIKLLKKHPLWPFFQTTNLILVILKRVLVVIYI